MHIKELIVDGFKSYANRTVISGWDSEFNAITGFNGTGKSNLLDAICFVLGISNLSQVRVAGLQELVYKQGQSRVSRASVTIVFDNRAKSKSPIGYEECAEITVTRQVVIGGRNKYLVNGHTAQLARVQNLFHSVGLNVNNPHFLIMQGRITKVCNMRPLETLGLIEEAAGTKMFEVKKVAAQKTIVKKQAKVDEINRVMEEEIQPVLDQLRNEKANFYRYNANKNEIELLQKFAYALQYWNGTSKLEKLARDIEETQSAQQALQNEVEQAAMSVELKQKAVAELAARKESEFSANAAYLELESRGSALSKALVQATAQWQNSKESLAEEQNELKKLEKARDAAAKTLATKKAEAAAAEAKAAQASKEHARIAQDVANIRSAQLGIVVGEEGEGASKEQQQGGFAGQLMAAQKQLAEEEGSVKASATKLKHMSATLKEQEAALKAGEKEGAAVAKDLATKQGLVAKLQAQLLAQNFDPAAKQAKEARMAALRDEVAQLSYECDALEARLGSRLKFEYNARAAGVAPDKVKGLVASLVRVADPAHSTAVELTAGAKLYNVVVDTEATGKALLEKGQLRRRVTIIPLNKIVTRTVAPGVVSKAEQMAVAGGGQCKLALSVVGYDADVGAAMSYIFGQSFVVSDAALAAKITFHPEVRTKCITLDGDVYDPSGTMEGGSLPSGPSILAQLQKVNEMHAARDHKDAELAALAKALAEMAAGESRALAAKKQLDVLQIELKSLQSRQAQSEHFVLAEAVAASRAQMETIKEHVSSSDARKAALRARISELEGVIRDFEGARAEKGAALEKRLASLAKEQAAAAKAQAEQGKKSSMLAIEVGELAAELGTLDAAIAKQTSESLGALVKQIGEREAEVEVRRAEFDTFSAALQAEKDKHSALDKSISKLNREMASLNKAATEAQLEAKKGSNTLARLVGERADAQKAINRMEKELDWITGEKHLFGTAGSDYDFGGRDSTAQLARLASLQAEQEALSKRINKKVMGMFEKAEAEAAELNKKRAIILDDKAQIEHVISELDVEKTRTLHDTWRTVSDSFGTIFSTLLPGVAAKLVLADGASSVMDGLDIRVSFGGVEKESLSELSGGQRSLLALSLILALLKFKPAPMYILDEIDAALDLSHTQNIGQVLKKHFSESQFIVVSLKEGMFNNANVLFRTKFVDGVSTVIRTTASDRKQAK